MFLLHKFTFCRNNSHLLKRIIGFISIFVIILNLVLYELSIHYLSYKNKEVMLKNKQSNYKVLYEKYIDQMYSYGRALGVDEDTLYDLIHDVFLHFFDHQNEISEGEHEKNYLLRCLKNRFISQKRKEVGCEELIETEDYFFQISVSGLDRIEEEEERKELTEQIENMLQCLTGRQREAIYLRYMQELEYDEIAVLLGLTTKGSRKLIYRAINRIRENYLLLLFY